MNLKDRIDINNLPKSIAIIMDGNGRWAKKKGKVRIFGHQHGVKPVRDVVEAAAELGVEYVTLYAFSKENWNRPKYEVDALMSLLVKTIAKEVQDLNKNNIRLQTIGDINNLPKNSRIELQKAIDSTSNNTRMTLVLALSYGSRWEILEATKSIARKIKNGEIEESDINEESFAKELNTSEMPDPELLIRTSGELRISNFLMWQIAYSELYFTEVLWPDFTKDEFYNAIIDYQGRERRFGKTSEQIQRD